jgi:hypothetical protein
MTDPFTDQGLADRTRVMDLDATAEYIPRLQVDELFVGATKIHWGQGTRYANGKLIVEGREDNSIELKLLPGINCQGKGVMAEIEIFGRRALNWFKRFGISTRFDGEGDLITVDSTSHESVSAMPLYMPVMGAQSRGDGTDVPNTEHYSFSYFYNGTHEMHLKNDTVRVEIASFAEAFMANDRSLMKARELVNGKWVPKVFTNDTTIDGL